MKELSFRKAADLAFLLRPFIPKQECATGIDFIGILVDNIVKEDKHEVFIDALLLMTDATIDDLLTIKPEDSVTLFTEGLVNNKILSLIEFCNKV